MYAVGFVFWVAKFTKSFLIAYEILSLSPDFKSVYLYRIATIPQYRKLGIGKILLQKIISFLQKKKYKMILLHINIENVYVKCLYDRFGFFVISKDKGAFIWF